MMRLLRSLLASADYTIGMTRRETDPDFRHGTLVDAMGAGNDPALGGLPKNLSQSRERASSLQR
jgi:hypothetical protein